MFRIAIPKPCHVSWENMTPAEKGRYCAQCATTVIDFSDWTDKAIQQYFIDRAGASFCGRFKNTQLDRIRIDLPRYILQKTMPFWKRFLLVVLICFGGAFMGIDTMMAAHNFYQGQPVAALQQHKKIIHAKKRHKKRFSISKKIIFDPQVLATYGMTTRTEIPEINLSDSTPFPATNPFAPLNSYSNACESAALTKNGHEDDNKKKPFENNTPINAFVIPTALATRNPFSKKKK